jgi:hypothetical protein
MRIVFDDLTDRVFSYGVSQGVLFRPDGSGVPWNGLISVTEKGDAGSSQFYFEGRQYLSRPQGDSFAGSISAYTYPDEFEPCIGIVGVSTAQPRVPFSFSYRTNNEIHIVYNAMVDPSQRAYETLTEQVNPVTFDWSFTTLPIKIPGGKPTSHVVILVNSAPPTAITALEDILYGTDGNDILDSDGNVIGNDGLVPSLPAIPDLVTLFESNATLQIVDNGDGTWTANGPDDVVIDNGDDTFTIIAPSAYTVDGNTFIISSY